MYLSIKYGELWVKVDKMVPITLYNFNFRTFKHLFNFRISKN